MITRRRHAQDPPLADAAHGGLKPPRRRLSTGEGVPGKSRSLLRERVSVSDAYEFIDAEKDVVTEVGEKKYTITTMCSWLGVSASGYDEWRDRPDSATTQRRAYLAIVITKIVEDSDATYGHRRVHAQLARQGEAATPELVRGIMREQDLVPCQPRPRHSLTEADPAAGVIPDLLARDFTATAPGEKMVDDITYISTWEGWLYLATVIECHTKSVLGWATGRQLPDPAHREGHPHGRQQL